MVLDHPEAGDGRYLARGPRVAVRPLTRADGPEFTRLVRASTDLHRPWLSMPDTEATFAAYADRLDGEQRVGLLVCLPGEEGAADTPAGFININNIVRGAFLCGALGYGAFSPSAGRGYLGEGLGLVLRHAFGPLGLHRLEANVQPGNTASLRLVKRHGFRLEGFSPGFLFIDGAWRDHERWAITADMLPES
ncbi:GNAT family N-acetyltransferase [Streptomyces albireticuli]|uniref:RimJ/RimL family protein N-acetyltransferase n=1 Tax=Streptomyces albireticuli TaxID=1940 RepID=A0A2A2DC18_9ACTN|nr:GNAT family protein [Streptomyces albireticuli]MCD9140825.1 GNAT family N-acetyltransferase [Streptomyces albireticuli]MCD9161213.1 GNAT family N-acetyltransferase [Streptomyces albireticuli]MCD9190729.1 GNAT family N-acetyltransferase [Streptomyces albireticuli]PAU48987.1 RimJ/RimL family protein N-acetyltransferase [Streptomyces albireticuli]